MQETVYCIGCGAELQTENPGAPGYAPASSLEKEQPLCKRCFRLKHYNEIEDVDLTDDDFHKMISSVAETDSLIVHLIDIFDTTGSMVPSLGRIIGDNPVILVGNKVDLLPKSTNLNKLEQWLRSAAKEQGMRVKDVFLISSKKGLGIEELSKAIETERDGKDVYVIGMTNVGKSTFINRLISDSVGEDQVITTSYFPGTTLGFIEIPLDENTALIDTPGLINREQMAHYVSAEDLKLITPRKEIKPRVYQLNAGQTLYFGGLARIDFIKGERQSFVCYFSNELPIHRTKLEKADALYEEHAGKLLAPPDAESLEMLPPLTKSTFKIGDKRTDMVFPGLGWVSLTEGNATVSVSSPKYVRVSKRNSLI